MNRIDRVITSIVSPGFARLDRPAVFMVDAPKGASTGELTAESAPFKKGAAKA